MPKKSPKEEILQMEYHRIETLFGAFAEELADQLCKLLADASISLAVPIQQRTKSWASIADKLERVGVQLKTIAEIQDLVGLRVILLFRKDVLKVIELINSNFSVLKSYDAADRLKEDQFGYASAHLVVSLPEEWLAVPTLASFRGMKAEIQVRTLAQHMWAETSHVLQYKREDTVPPSVRRSLYRGSALLELLDIEFDRILKERETYRKTVDVKASDALLNVDNLGKILDSLLPRNIKQLNEPYAELLRELQHFEIDTADKLKRLVSVHLDVAIKEDKERIKNELDNLAGGKSVSGSTEERVKGGLFYTHAGYIRNILRSEFGKKALDDYWNAQRQAARKNS